MNNTIIVRLLLVVFFFKIITIEAQYAESDSVKVNSKLEYGKLEPFWLTVTYDKTTHLIFPAKIKYVDLGSNSIVASKADEAENVLRVKASVRDFDGETNFSVVTEDGRFYNFDVLYSAYPSALSFDLFKLEAVVKQRNYQDIIFEDLSGELPSLVDLFMESIDQRNKRYIRHIGSRKFGITFSLKGIYTDGGKYFFDTEILNDTNIPFDIDFVVFKLVDKKVAKRTVIQEAGIPILRMYRPLDQIGRNEKGGNVFVTDHFTTADDKILLIEIYEKNGSRHQILQVENKDLISAKILDQLPIKFKNKGQW